jgi:mannose-6-phosphate isomerase-like protein (cupin superfamily)
MDLLCKNLFESKLNDTQNCHGGERTIHSCRILTQFDFKAACNFVDYAVVPPNSSIGLHRHGENEELYLIIEGTGTMTVDDHIFKVKTGDLVVNRPGGQHGLTNDSTSDIKLFVIEIPCLK